MKAAELFGSWPYIHKCPSLTDWNTTPQKKKTSDVVSHCSREGEVVIGLVALVRRDERGPSTDRPSAVFDDAGVSQSGLGIGRGD